MNEDVVDVLIVDDDIAAVQVFAQLVATATGLNVSHTADPERALEIVRSNSVKVLVLDQRMPFVSGTELFARIRSIDPAARAIMLTGAATNAEIGEALDLGFNFYLSKIQISDLPQQVLKEYAAYLEAAGSGHV